MALPDCIGNPSCPEAEKLGFAPYGRMETLCRSVPASVLLFAVANRTTSFSLR